jgi:hypothetical protein
LKLFSSHFVQNETDDENRNKQEEPLFHCLKTRKNEPLSL